MVTRCNVWSRGVVGHRVGTKVASSYLARRLLRVTWHEGCLRGRFQVGLYSNAITWHTGCFHRVGIRVALTLLPGTRVACIGLAYGLLA